MSQQQHRHNKTHTRITFKTLQNTENTASTVCADVAGEVRNSAANVKKLFRYVKNVKY